MLAFDHFVSIQHFVVYHVGQIANFVGLAVESVVIALNFDYCHFKMSAEYYYCLSFVGFCS